MQTTPAHPGSGRAIHNSQLTIKNGGGRFNNFRLIPLYGGAGIATLFLSVAMTGWLIFNQSFC
jgi:hypothetical protein